MYKYIVYGFFLMNLSLSSYADSCIVNLASDNNPGGEGEAGDLRYCLNEMNQYLNSPNASDYEITFDFPNNYPQTISLNGVLPIINNSSSLININIGNILPSQKVMIDGDDTFPGFLIANGNVTLQNMIFSHVVAKGGEGGDGLSGGGGGMGAGGAIYVANSFFSDAAPSVKLINVSINNAKAIGGNGGSATSTTNDGGAGGGGGGGFIGNGGSVTVTGQTGGGGGGGFGGNGGNVTVSTNDPNGGGGGGGGGIGSCALIGDLFNLGHGGDDNQPGLNGSAYGLANNAGSGAGGFPGGLNAGGGGGGGDSSNQNNSGGGGGGGNYGSNGSIAQGSIPPAFLPRSETASSGGIGSGGGGGGGGGVVKSGISNTTDGTAGSGGYAGGGGGGAGLGFSDVDYRVSGGLGGVGGGGGGGGAGSSSGNVSAQGGDSSAGGGGGGGGLSSAGGIDQGNLGGGAGGSGSETAGGGGGGGGALGGAIFIDGGLNFTIQALSGIPTNFDTLDTSTTAGAGGSGLESSLDGSPGLSLDASIFLRNNSRLTLIADQENDSLILGEGVSFSSFNPQETLILVTGKGLVEYQGNSNYNGIVRINNAHFKLNGTIEGGPIAVCRDTNVGAGRGRLSGHGVLTGNVFVNSGEISPEAGRTLSLGPLTLSSSSNSALGSLVHIEINSAGTSLIHVSGYNSEIGNAALAGILEINLDPNTPPGVFTILESEALSGQFDEIRFVGRTPLYRLNYLPADNPTYVQFEFLGYPPSVQIPATLNGSTILNPAVVCCGRPVLLGELPVPGADPTVYQIINKTGNVQCKLGKSGKQWYLKMNGSHGSCTIVGSKNGTESVPLTILAPNTPLPPG